MKYENITILYVEDEPNVRVMLGQFISRFCETIYIAENGEEGLELYKKHSVDIVISDIKMPKLNGIDMVEEMKKINPKQLVIFTTAHIDSEYLFKAIELQIDGYISKPVDLDKLKVQIDKCLLEIEAKDAVKKLQESEARFRTVIESTQLGIFIYKEKFIYVNSIFSDMIGYTPEEIYKMNAWSLVSEEEQPFVKSIVKRRLQGEKFPLNYKEATIVTKDGIKRKHRVVTETIEYEGSFAGLGTTLDITEIIETKERLKLLAQAMEQMDEMVRITDKNGFITYVNEALIKHTHYKKSELIGNTNAIFKSGKHSSEFYKKMYDTILSKKVFRGTFINLKKNREIYYEEQVITPILNEESDEIENFVSTSKDVTERIKLEKKLKKLATVDALTGIYNRYSVNQKIEEEISRMKRFNGVFALMMFDIDFFKKVNDTYGHDVGDYVLQEFSKIVTHSIRTTDIFGRWGGEEFMLLAPNESLKGAILLAEKIRKNVEEYEFKTVKKITVSIGLTVCNGYSEKEKLLKKVDEALYKAKESGRNKVVYQECACAD